MKIFSLLWKKIVELPVKYSLSMPEADIVIPLMSPLKYSQNKYETLSKLKIIGRGLF